MDTKARRRQRLGAAGWRAALKRFEESGSLGAREFCEREGLGQASFYRWRRRLSEEPGRDTAEVPHEASKPAGFLDLGTLNAKGARLELRMDLGAGVVLHLVRG